MKTATKIQDLKGGASWVKQSLYKLEPPLHEETWDGEVNDHVYVVASASNNPAYGVYETYLFPADAEGEITYWGELEGSERGILSHEKVFANIGYTIVEGEA